jgi:arylsulfatase A-like enzyme/Flp pilus assembly protein TadD
MKTFPFALLLSGLAGCGSPENPEASEAMGPSVILVTLDTTRADRIGAYGYEKARTETIDALSAKGRRFSQAFSPVPLTIPAHASLFTGLDPFNHGVRSNSTERLEESFTTMAEILRYNGYQTWASVAAFVTQSSWGFGQGFDDYAERLGRAALDRHENVFREERPAELVVNDALGFLKERREDAPFFMWVHLFDAHEPMTPPAAYLGEGIDPYDAEIAYMDDQLERLVQAVEGDEVLWVIVADHGESLGEHGEQTHGLFVYNSTQHIPLIFSGPGVPVDVQDEPVSLVDVLPTLLSHLDISIPEGLDGSPQPGNPHPIYMESHELSKRFGWAPHVGLVHEGSKLIQTPRPELYALSSDFGEQRNVAAEDSESLARMSGLLAEMGATLPGESTKALDAETQERLEALGYVQGGVTAGSGADSKDKMAVLELILKSERVARAAGPGPLSEELRSAIVDLRRVIQMEPTLFEPQLRLARLLAKVGQVQEAITVLEEARTRWPESVNLLLSTAVHYGTLQQFDKVDALAREAYGLKPNSVRALEILMTSLLFRKRGDEALALGEAYLDRNPESALIAGFLGIALATRADYRDEGDLNRAQEYLRQGLKTRFPRKGIRHHLAIMAHAAGVFEDVISFAEAELADYPASQKTRRLLVRILGQTQRYGDQIPHLEVLRKQNPDSIQALHAHAQGLWNAKRFEAAEDLLREGLAKAPSNAALLMLKANVLDRNGESAAAQVAYHQALAAKKAEVSEAE